MLQTDTDFAPDGDRTAFSTIGMQQQGFCFNCATSAATPPAAAPSPRSTAATAATRDTRRSTA
eukprot:2811999-Prymnesium_polylepis.1